MGKSPRAWGIRAALRERSLRPWRRSGWQFFPEWIRPYGAVPFLSGSWPAVLWQFLFWVYSGPCSNDDINAGATNVPSGTPHADDLERHEQRAMERSALLARFIPLANKVSRGIRSNAEIARISMSSERADGVLGMDRCKKPRSGHWWRVFSISYQSMVHCHGRGRGLEFPRPGHILKDQLLGHCPIWVQLGGLPKPRWGTPRNNNWTMDVPRNGLCRGTAGAHRRK